MASEEYGSEFKVFWLAGLPRKEPDAQKIFCCAHKKIIVCHENSSNFHKKSVLCTGISLHQFPPKRLHSILLGRETRKV